MRISDWSSDVCSSDLDGSQRIQRLFLAVNARSCTQHITPELRLPFIDPQQRIAHWRTEIRRRKSHRPAIFAVPAMRQFMGQDVASARPLVPTCEIFGRSEEHTSELQSLMLISYAVFCLKQKTQKHKR